MSHRLPHILRHGATSLGLVLSLSTPLHAQSLRLHVTEATSGLPVAGGIADVLDSLGAVVAQGVLSADGRRLLALPGPGRYRVRVRRIGYEPFVTNAPAVAGVGSPELALAVPARRIILSAILVNASRCSRDAFRNPEVAALWEEVRKALTSTVLSREDSTLTFETRSFRRKLDGDRITVEELVGLPRLTTGGKPYVSLAPDDLSKNGYVRRVGDETVFYAPDEEVLLANQFVDDHCFEVTSGTGATDGLFGLHFTSASRNNLNDIAGTLWVDSASAELRYLDFWYAHQTMPIPVIGEGKSGGQMIFQRLPTGLWIVSAWRLRMPRFESHRRVTRRSYPDWYEEFGGVVTPAAGDSLTPSAVLQPYRELLAPARVTGTVYDSLAGKPRVGAQVWILPAEPPDVIAAGLASGGGRLSVNPIADTTDATGHFSLRALPAGTYRLAFEDAVLDSLGVQTARYDIRLRPGATIVGELTVPSLATLRIGCAMPAGAGNAAYGGMVMGIVRAAGDERPLADALVQASWVDLRRDASVLAKTQPTVVATHTDSVGRYRICAVPDSAMATVMAAGPHSATGAVQTQVGPLGISRVNLRLAEVAEGESAPPPGILVGTVSDTLGRPVTDALVTLDGQTVETRTDAAGRFRLSPVQPGTQTVEVKRLGLEPARRAVDIAPDATTTVSLTLVRSFLLDPVFITARSNRHRPEVADAMRRHLAGTGVLFTEQQIQQRASVQSLLQGIPGVRTTLGQGGSMQWVALMRKGGSECEARVFIDGRESGYDEVLSLVPDQLAAVEVFVRASTAPIFTAGRSTFGRDETCGSIIFWVKH